jgi:hypothetical protein
MAKFKKGGGWNEPDSMGDLGAKQGWHGANYSGRKLASFDGSNGRGAYGFAEGKGESFGPLGEPDCIDTASAAGESVIQEVASRGTTGFGVAGWKDIFGKPTKPGKA